MSATATLPTLSFWQPWAALLVHGCKRVETRAWRWTVHLPCVLAVHAAQHWSGELADLSRRQPFHALLASLGMSWPASGGLPAPPRGMTFGGVVGLVRLCAFVPTERIARLEGDGPPAFDPGGWLGIGATEAQLGDYGPGRFGWLTDRRLALPEPIPLRGFQSVWQWPAPPDVLALAEDLREEQG